MKEQHQQLIGLVELLPANNSARSCSQLNTILTKYNNILDYINGYNAELKRATSVYYTDIASIRDNIQQSAYSTSQREKDEAYEKAMNELKTDIQALAMLIQPEDELVAVTV